MTLFFVVELNTPTRDGRKYIHHGYRPGASMTTQLTWRLSGAKTWKTRKGVEEWLEKHPGYKLAAHIVEIEEE